ncbi:formin-like protein 11 [Cajanus cajan]|uniref:Formin-like protein n=1 Tax=Cajanus cajan TaxID=3821 RepID=A0A151TVV7_CAJCA|nr:formin-like protein 11 [Cajanus cajan]KYP71209.1 Formin-like protein 11 [Cajanus cajan]
MGLGSEAHSMIFIITIMMFPSLQRANILTVDATLNAAGNENHVKKISGMEENENKHTPIVENFKALFGLDRFNTRRPYSSVSDSDFVSLSHSESPNTKTEAPSPRYHSHRNMPLNNIQQQDRGVAKRTTLVAVLVPGGVAALICALACVCVCRKFRTQKKKPNRTIPLSSNNGRTKGTCQNSSSNVSFNPDPDLFYLTCLKQTCDTQNSTSSHGSLNRTIYEKQVARQCDYASSTSSSTNEILSVHEDLEYDGGCKASYVEKTVTGEYRSSDNESFHSCVDSHSSISETETLSLSPRNLISSTNQFPCSPQNSTSKLKSNQSPCGPKHEEQKKTEISHPSNSIPPPPCPPSFLKGNINSVKSPLPKLKPLHWDKVRATPDRTMVWDKLRTSSFKLDEEMIESLFAYNLQNSMKNDETKSKSPSHGMHVLEPKRLQNIAILSKALNTTAEQACDTLALGKGLSLQQLEALVKMAPTKEEEAKLLTYKVNELGSAEKFVRTMLSIPFAFQRVEAMLYRETFEDEVVHLCNSFSTLEEACKELRSSKFFLKLLEAVLKTGNRMNVGTIRGGARAFKLDALLKLADVKGTDGKTTLLHFFVQEIVRSEGMKASESIMGQKSENRTEEEKEEVYRRMGIKFVSGLSAELCNVKKAATIDVDVLACSISNLSSGMANMQKMVKALLCEDEKSERFVVSMKCFLSYAERKVQDLQGDEGRVMGRVREITEYFHGDVSKDEPNPLRIFVIVRDFLEMVDNVCNELRRSIKSPRTIWIQ